MAVVGGPALQFVLKEFELNKPAALAGHVLDEWCKRVGKEAGLTAHSVRSILAYQIKRDADALIEKKKSDAQTQLDIAGATEIEAAQALARALKAKKRRPLMARGVPVRDAEGNLVWVETEDHAVRLAAAKQVFEIKGAYAPQKIEVEHGISEELRELTEEALSLRLAEVHARLGKVQTIEAKAVDVTKERTPETNSRGGGPRKGVSLPAGAAGPFLLADGVDQDQG